MFEYGCTLGAFWLSMVRWDLHFQCMNPLQLPKQTKPAGEPEPARQSLKCHEDRVTFVVRAILQRAVLCIYLFALRS